MGTFRTTAFLLTFTLMGACNQGPLFDEIPQSQYDRFKGRNAGFHTLFGLPPETGPISEDCCMPTCAYEVEDETQGDEEDPPVETWTAPRYTLQEMETLYYDWKLAKPWPLFEGDENDVPPENDDPGFAFFCAVVPRPDLKTGEGGPMPYMLETITSSVEAWSSAEAESMAELLPEGAMITHRGACGACSSLRNLAVYIANNNLTEPIRGCATAGLFDRDLSRLACIASLGFDLPCAQAWEINTLNTQELCGAICGRPRNRTAPSNKPFQCSPEKFAPPDIKLVNNCLACDELFSLELFRGKAGRSRRGSGLPSPICRRCDTVFRVEHRYPVPAP